MSALALVLDARSRRTFLAVVTMSRMIDTGLSLAEEKKVIPALKHRDLYLWLFTNLCTQYALSCNKDILNKGVAKFYTHWAQMYPNDKIQVDVWHRMRADKSPFW